jgi:PleD family two-component response regulator
MDLKTLKLLLVEDDLEDEQLLCEALIEIEENRLWCNWRNAEVIHVDQLADALDCLRAERFDAVLLNLSLPDSPSLLDTFLQAQACSGGAAIVVLADQEDEHLANRVLREGAQDVFLKTELECAPLARSVRYAIERQRRDGAGSSPLIDNLTGTLTRRGLVAVAGHYARLAFDRHIDLLVVELEVADIPDQTAEDREARELVLMHTGEVLRDVFEGPALAGHLERCRFGLVIPGMSESTAAALLETAAALIEIACSPSVANVRFRIAELNPGDDIEELLEARGLPASEAKTVMLAD